MNEYLQRIAIYAALGTVLSSIGAQWDTALFWCAVALFWISNYLERREGLEVGIASGIEMIADMTDEQRAEVIALVKQAQKEDNE